MKIAEKLPQPGAFHIELPELYFAQLIIVLG